jgi:spore germination protein GerM
MACLALTAGLLTGCGVPQDDEPRALDPSLAPFDVFQQQETSAPTGDDQAALYFVRDDRVVRQTRRVEAPADLTAVLELLLEGPTPGQVEDGIRSALPSTFTVEGVELGSNGVAVVTLGGSSTQISTSPLAFAQVVATLTAPGRAQAVRFRLDGQDLPVPRGDASVTEAPVDRRDYAELLGPAPDEPTEAEGATEPPAADPLPSSQTGSPAPG